MIQPTEHQLVYMLTLMGADTGFSLIRPNDDFTAQDALSLRDQLSEELRAIRARQQIGVIE